LSLFAIPQLFVPNRLSFFTARLMASPSTRSEEPRISLLSLLVLVPTPNVLWRYLPADTHRLPKQAEQPGNRLATLFRSTSEPKAIDVCEQTGTGREA
jgi:hypothetical protein